MGEIRNGHTELLRLGSDGGKANAILAELSELIVSVAGNMKGERKEDRMSERSGRRRLVKKDENLPELDLHTRDEDTR